MSNRRRGDHSKSIVISIVINIVISIVILCIAIFVAIFGVGVVNAVGGGAIVGAIVVGGVAIVGAIVVVGVVDGVSKLVRERRLAAHLRAIPPSAPRTLRWVRGLLPGDEGAAWLAEVGSCLTETTDEGERRRYVRSYCRGVPRLIWTSWTEHLSASHRRTLS